jgi:hypothetical protein
MKFRTKPKRVYISQDHVSFGDVHSFKTSLLISDLQVFYLFFHSTGTLQAIILKSSALLLEHGRKNSQERVLSASKVQEYLDMLDFFEEKRNILSSIMLKIIRDQQLSLVTS